MKTLLILLLPFLVCSCSTASHTQWVVGTQAAETAIPVAQEAIIQANAAIAAQQLAQGPK